jgi:molecular chaperone DnaK (HSP70)
MDSPSNDAPSRYVVGLDLGTTNSALAYVDTHHSPTRIRTFAVPQAVAAGHLEALETLPSFHYQPAKGEFSPGALRLPWQKSDPAYTVGVFARDQGTLSPARLINSAKSWLCHPGVDRTAELLPWHGASDVDRLSPITVSARYLQHYREAWDAQFSEHPLAEQDFVLTLPASFDEVARELTIRAAQQAGLTRVVLIEEPQAAFYAWIDKHADRWEQLVSPGQKILVCDIGGGTTDFTLIRVRRGDDGLVQFHRVAVGEHLILGGDNFDLALAHHLERRLKGDGKLEPRQWSSLVRSCRQLKETLLGERPPAQYTLTLPGAGSKLIGGGLQTPVSRDEVEQVVVEGFFPLVELTAPPNRAQSGFQEFGLPYAPDPAVTKYLAAFLTAHRNAGDVSRPRDGDPWASKDARPDLLLFNGGVFESPMLRQRLIDQLHAWFRANDPRWSITVLDNDRLDLAVARGAAYYGMVRRGQGVRIAAGLARTYYIGVERSPGIAIPGSPQTALCLCPAGLEPGHDIDLTARQFELRLGQPIEFPLFFSSTRLNDQPGELVAVEREQLTALPPIRTVLKAARSNETGIVRVQLHARLTEIGTLDLWCAELDGKRRWKLLFDVRSATQTDVAATASTAAQQGVFDDATSAAASQVIARTFRAPGEDPSALMKRLSDVIGLAREDWPTTLLRQMWEALIAASLGRKLSPQHEARWLNLLGYALRPGYGLAVDDWRVAETWKLLQGKLVHSAPMCRVECWILWRRVAGGLTSGQQQALAAPVAGVLGDWVKSAGKPRSDGVGPHELSEQCRLLGSLEWLSPALKQQLGQLMLEIAESQKHVAVRSAALWALGRIGARRPVYGPLNTVLSPETIVPWLTRAMYLEGTDPMESFAVMQLARKTDDRYRDLDDSTRAAVLKWMDRAQAPRHFRRLVREAGTLEVEEQGLVFGEALPQGLRIL